MSERESESECSGAVLRFVCVSLFCVSMPLDEIRSMIRAEHATLLDATLQKLEGVIDARLAGQEARLMKEISSLQKRTEQLELRDRDRACRCTGGKETSTKHQCRDWKCRYGEKCSSLMMRSDTQ